MTWSTGIFRVGQVRDSKNESPVLMTATSFPVKIRVRISTSTIKAQFTWSVDSVTIELTVLSQIGSFSD
jgi:hypothetical protein